jgi:prevent-host-death family protein
MDTAIRQINIHEAKTNLSNLVKEAANGSPFVIAISGKPMATVIPYQDHSKQKKRIGFLSSPLLVPSDFDSMGSKEIINMFEGNL